MTKVWASDLVSATKKSVPDEIARAAFLPEASDTCHVAIPTDISLLSLVGGEAARQLCNV